MDGGRRAPRMVSKSPVRSGYTDANTKSPMKERVFGAPALNADTQGGRPPSKSPLRSRYADASRKTPTRERNLGSSDVNRKSPLRGRMPAVPNKEEIKEIVMNSTDSFSVWLPVEDKAGQNQVELNKHSSSPRERRTRGSGDPSIKQKPEPAIGIPRRIDEEHDNVYGTRHSGVGYDDWVQEDDYGRRRRNTDVRYDDRPRGRMGYQEAERVVFHEAPPDNRSGYGYGYDDPRGSRSRYNGPANVQNVAIRQAEILRMYNELGEEIDRMGNRSYNQGRGGEFYDDADDYAHDEFLRVRRGPVQSGGHNGSPRMMHNYVADVPIRSRFMQNELPFHDDPSPPRITQRTTYNDSRHHQKQYVPTRHIDTTHDPRTEYKTRPHRQALPIPDSTDAYGKPKQDSAFRNPTPNNLSSHSRSSVDSAKKLLVVNKNQQLCHPIAGGAPFVICCKCSKLLRLPQKVRTMKKNQCKLQCGSCRAISLYDFGKKKSDASFQTIFKSSATDVPVELVSKSDDKNHGHNSVAALANRESFYFNKMRPGLSPSSSSSSHASKDDKSSESVGQDDKPLTNSVISLRPPPGSPLRYSMDYSDMLTAERDASSLNDAEIAAIQTKLNQDSDEDPKNIGSPNLPSLRSSPAKADVYVNGQPITRDAVRSAEKMAGTISAGAYWYDKRAGFWGIMGGHCLGIIAPFIEEFKAQMPENCSSGDTCIYVNGRELHKHDLDMLSGRGLPRTRYKYYIVDLSGKVQDEDTSRFVVNIGKLAPNVEKTGRGFGMHPPEMRNS